MGIPGKKLTRKKNSETWKKKGVQTLNIYYAQREREARSYDGLAEEPKVVDELLRAPADVVYTRLAVHRRLGDGDLGGGLVLGQLVPLEPQAEARGLPARRGLGMLDVEVEQRGSKRRDVQLCYLRRRG